MLKRSLWIACWVLIIGVGMMLWIRSQPENAVGGILTDRPCAPPCWQGITPGMVATRDELTRRLRRIPGVKTIWENGPCVMWLWDRWEGYSSICVDQDNVVRSISLSVDFDLTVKEIIDKYGPPDATNAVYGGVPEHPYVAMNLLYPVHGMWVRAKVLPDYNPTLEPTTKVYEVLYVAPSDSLENWPGVDITNLHLQPWPGYGALPPDFIAQP